MTRPDNRAVMAAAGPMLPGVVVTDPGVSRRARCFVIDAGDWEHPHFSTLAEASAVLAATVAEDVADGAEPSMYGIYQPLTPCVEVSCACGAFTLGEDDEDSDGEWLHFASVADAEQYAADQGFTLAADGWLVFDADTAAQELWTGHWPACASLREVSPS